MKQEDRELLLRDLCGRIPYGVKCTVTKSRTEEGQKGDIGKIVCVCLEGVDCIGDEPFFSEFGNFKPYLFPISSMTEEQKTSHNFLKHSAYASPIKLIDFYNKNHFDYRGLIPMGLVIDATNLNVY